MKRPFATVGFTSFAVLLFSAFIGRSDVTLYACVSFFALGLLTLFIREIRQTVTVPVCFFTAAAVCLLFLDYNEEVKHTQGLAGENVEVTARVCEAPYMKDNGRHYCVLELETAGGERATGKLRLSFSASDLETFPCR